MKHSKPHLTERNEGDGSMHTCLIRAQESTKYFGNPHFFFPSTRMEQPLQIGKHEYINLARKSCYFPTKRI